MPSNIDTLLPDSLWMFAGDLVPNLSCRLSTRKEVKGQGGVRNDSFFHKHICCLEAMQIPFSASREWGQEVGNGRGMIEKRKRTGRGECGGTDRAFRDITVEHSDNETEPILLEIKSRDGVSTLQMRSH